ncbi:MAG TPA: molybdenum cofactor biosynthesis protein MoaE [Spirochaetia bacterium]|nr:molybdenum cofactor biosynthesis protein MoaE [Spirochaetia bacterium]
MEADRARFELTAGPIDAAHLTGALADSAAGACVTFEGRVRDHNDGRVVSSLEYEAYERMALREGAAVMVAALEQFPIISAVCVHRTGHLSIGDTAVWIGVLSAHRDEAFAACRYIIDEVKSRVPIWKSEHFAPEIVPRPETV